MEINAIPIMLIVVFDVVIIAILLLVFFRNGRGKNALSTNDLRQLKSLYALFEKAMADSTKASHDLLRDFDNKISMLQDVLGKTGTSEKKLRKKIIEAEQMIATSAVTQPRQYSNNHEDSYQKAADLITRGRSLDEIRSASGLSTGEIDLIKQLGGYKS